ncbi:6-carboxytetrahydropterin synthase [Glaciecola siphonariae]|uniref:6-carboxy-5,6,7,8-tetrahydropterin synthase n=1 Tax=Glaciecola siphonariae TaxID=521012 RepID=A0ABV9LUK6_9ALTE
MKLFVNDLTVMDFSYLCPKRGMVGESWIVDIVLDGGLNEESMVQDFGIVKKQLKRLIDDYVDHKLVVPAECERVRIAKDQTQGRVQVDFSFGADSLHNAKTIHLLCPPEAYAFVYDTSVNMASVTAYLKDIIKTHLPDNVQGIDIFLREEVINSAFYHYTHGLKKHDGNCQRIAHGHRSKVVIIENGERSEQREQFWAKRWADIYIGTREDLVKASELKLSADISDDTHYCFAYESSQGEFEMAIVKSSCEIIEYDSTVECLAQFMLERLTEMSDSSFMVSAFEGVGKGAIISND